MSTTRFSYILSRLGIRPVDLVEHTGLDKTLVSRWKNGHRKLSPSSQNTYVLADYLLQQPGAKKTIELVLESYGMDMSQNALRDNFVFWLTEQEPPELQPSVTLKTNDPDSEYTASFNMFVGHEGASEGIMMFLDYALLLPPGSECVMVFCNEPLAAATSFIGQPDFAKDFSLLAEKLLRRGITLTLIHPAGDTLDPEILFPWIRSILKTRIQLLHYVPSEKIECDDLLTMSVKDGIGLHVRRDIIHPENMYTTVFTDPLTVRQTFNICKKFYDAASPYYAFDYFKSPDLRSAVSGAELLQTPQYLFSAEPPPSSIDDSLISDSLGPRYMNESRYKQLRWLFADPAAFEPGVFVRHALCVDLIQELLFLSRRRSPFLGVLVGADIYHSANKVKRTLSNILAAMQKNDGYEVALLPGQLWDERVPLGLLAYKDKAAAVWLPDGSNSAAFFDRAYVNNLFSAAAQLWDSIPPQYKDRATTIARLDELIKATDDD